MMKTSERLALKRGKNPAEKLTVYDIALLKYLLDHDRTMPLTPEDEKFLNSMVKKGLITSFKK